MQVHGKYLSICGIRSQNWKTILLGECCVTALSQTMTANIHIPPST
jgi:hypothetical protein